MDAIEIAGMIVSLFALMASIELWKPRPKN